MTEPGRCGRRAPRGAAPVRDRVDRLVVLLLGAAYSAASQLQVWPLEWHDWAHAASHAVWLCVLACAVGPTRLHPLMVALAVAGILLAPLHADQLTLWLALAVAMFVSELRRRRRGMPAVIVAGVLWPFLAGRDEPDVWGAFVGLFAPLLLVAYYAAHLIGAALERDRRAHRALLDAEMAHRRDRTDLAIEIHDGLARELTLLAIEAENLARDDADADLARRRRALAEGARAAREQFNALLRRLRSDADSAPNDAGPAPTLDDAVDAARRRLAGAGFAVEVDVPRRRALGLPSDVEACAARVVAEGAANVMAHAPGGVACRIRLDRDDDAISVDVVNEAVGRRDSQNGRGAGLGLIGVAEQVKLRGGVMRAGYSGDTWVLRAYLPTSAQG